MVLLCGEHGIDKKIRGVTIIEAPDIVKFINGGELLLTGLYAFRYCTTEEFMQYIHQLDSKEISGLIIKKGRKVAELEKKIRILEEYTETRNIPLIEVPFEVSFQQVMGFVMEHIFNEEVTMLKYFKTTHDNFTALSLASAHEKKPVERILDMLNKLIRNPVALYNQNMSCYASTNGVFTDLSLSPDAEEYDPGTISNYRYLKQQGTRTQYIVQIRLNVGVQMYLSITETAVPFSKMDCIAVENAIVALQYEFSRAFAVSELEKKYQNDILNNILNGKVTSAEELKKSTGLLGMDPDGHYRVIVLGIAKDGHEQKNIDEKLRQITLLEEVVRQQVADVKLHRDMDKVVIIQNANPHQTQISCRQELKDMLTRVQQAMEKKRRKLKIQAGAGKIVQGIKNLKKSYQEADDALAFIDISQEIIEDGNSPVMMFSDLGIFKLLCQLNDPEILLEYVPESLQKLYNYKKPQQEDLVITLKTYLNHNQNLSKTAQDLYVHYKTAAYRIEKISKITGMDFNNANEMLAVRIGLVVYKILENYEKK